MKVKVWNDNVYDFKQVWRGETIAIKAGDYIELEDDFAHNFLCAYHPIEVDAGGNQKPQSYKRLRIEGKAINVRDHKLTCQACGYVAVSKKDLLTHTNERLTDGKHTKLEDETGKLTPAEMIEGMSETDLQKLAQMLAAVGPKRGRPRKEAEADV